MVILSCLLSVSTDTACQSYNRTGNNGHQERTCLSGNRCRVVGGKMSLHGSGASYPENHGCLVYVRRRRDCRIGTLSIKTSVFVRKRESLRIWLIVCICSACFGDPTTLLEFLRWHCIYHKKPANQNILLIVIKLHVNCYIFFPLVILELLLTSASLLS